MNRQPFNPFSPKDLNALGIIVGSLFGTLLCFVPGVTRTLGIFLLAIVAGFLLMLGINKWKR